MMHSQLLALRESSRDYPRLWMRAIVVVTVVGLMVVMPAIAFAGKRPSPWGWQMYAGQAGVPDILVTKRNGDTQVGVFNEIVAWPRPEPDYLEPVARFICAKDDSVESVRLSLANPYAVEDFLCSGF